ARSAQRGDPEPMYPSRRNHGETGLHGSRLSRRGALGRDDMPPDAFTRVGRDVKSGRELSVMARKAGKHRRVSARTIEIPAVASRRPDGIREPRLNGAIVVLLDGRQDIEDDAITRAKRVDVLDHVVNLALDDVELRGMTQGGVGAEQHGEVGESG